MVNFDWAVGSYPIGKITLGSDEIKFIYLNDACVYSEEDESDTLKIICDGYLTQNAYDKGFRLTVTGGTPIKNLDQGTQWEISSECKNGIVNIYGNLYYTLSIPNEYKNEYFLQFSEERQSFPKSGQTDTEGNWSLINFKKKISNTYDLPNDCLFILDNYCIIKGDGSGSDKVYLIKDSGLELYDESGLGVELDENSYVSLVYNGVLGVACWDKNNNKVLFYNFNDKTCNQLFTYTEDLTSYNFDSIEYYYGGATNQNVIIFFPNDMTSNFTYYQYFGSLQSVTRDALGVTLANKIQNSTYIDSNNNVLYFFAGTNFGTPYFYYSIMVDGNNYPTSNASDYCQITYNGNILKYRYLQQTNNEIGVLFNSSNYIKVETFDYSIKKIYTKSLLDFTYLEQTKEDNTYLYIINNNNQLIKYDFNNDLFNIFCEGDGNSIFDNEYNSIKLQTGVLTEPKLCDYSQIVFGTKYYALSNKDGIITINPSIYYNLDLVPANNIEIIKDGKLTDFAKQLGFTLETTGGKPVQTLSEGTSFTIINTDADTSNWNMIYTNYDSWEDIYNGYNSWEDLYNN